MGFTKSFILGILNLLLIVSLSVLVMSIAFTLTINERALNILVDENLEPFLDAQTERTVANFTQQQLESEHQRAISICTTSDRFEVGRQGEDVIFLDCDKIRGTTLNQFLGEIKDAIKDYALNEVNESFDESAKKLKYATYALWVSIVISLVLSVTIILIAWGIPFKTFGVAGLIAGSPFLILLVLKPIISKKVQQEIQNTVSPELFEQFSQSALVDGITNLISNLFFDMIVGFAVLFFAGLILLTVGLLIKRKQPQTSQNV